MVQTNYLAQLLHVFGGEKRTFLHLSLISTWICVKALFVLENECRPVLRRHRVETKLAGLYLLEA